MRLIIICLSVISLFLLQCNKPENVTPLMYSDTCILNNLIWEHNVEVKSFASDSVIEIKFASNYNQYLSKSLYINTPFKEGYKPILFNDSFNTIPMFCFFTIVDEDLTFGEWLLDTTFGNQNWISIDSISNNRDFVTGSLNLHLVDNGFENRPPSDDPMIGETLYIRNASFKSKVTR